MKTAEFKLTVEILPTKKGATLPISRVTILADTFDDAVDAYKDFCSGKIDRKNIPKQGIDVRS